MSAKDPRNKEAMGFTKEIGTLNNGRTSTSKFMPEDILKYISSLPDIKIATTYILSNPGISGLS